MVLVTVDTAMKVLYFSFCIILINVGENNFYCNLCSSSDLPASYGIKVSTDERNKVVSRHADEERRTLVDL